MADYVYGVYINGATKIEDNTIPTPDGIKTISKTVTLATGAKVTLHKEFEEQNKNNGASIYTSGRNGRVSFTNLKSQCIIGVPGKQDIFNFLDCDAVVDVANVIDTNVPEIDNDIVSVRKNSGSTQKHVVLINGNNGDMANGEKISGKYGQSLNIEL